MNKLSTHSRSTSEKLFRYNGFGLLRQETIKHGFFTKNGGISQTPEFASLNCNSYSADEPSNILQNKKLIADDLGFEIDNLKTIHQIHSKMVITVLDYETPTNDLQADALVTNLPNLLLGITTADCAPILFYDPKHKVIGAAHAGWKGAVEGIIENTLNAMGLLGADVSNIFATIGPCIQQYSYEVDQNFYDQLVMINQSYQEFFHPSKQRQHYMFDLPGYCIRLLRASGVTKIENLGVDTYSNQNILFSYRRSFHEQAPSPKINFGTQLSVIGIKTNN